MATRSSEVPTVKVYVCWSQYSSYRVEVLGAIVPSLDTVREDDEWIADEEVGDVPRKHLVDARVHQRLRAQNSCR